MRAVLLLVLVSLIACRTPTAPTQVAVQVAVENMSRDTLIAWWWHPDGSFDFVKLPPLVGRGACIEYEATWLRLAAWQGATDLTGHPTFVERPYASGNQFWIIRAGGMIPSITPQSTPVC